MCCLALRQVTSKQIIQSTEPGQQVASGDYSKEVKLIEFFKSLHRVKTGQLSHLVLVARCKATPFTD